MVLTRSEKTEILQHLLNTVLDIDPDAKHPIRIKFIKLKLLMTSNFLKLTISTPLPTRKPLTINPLKIYCSLLAVVATLGTYYDMLGWSSYNTTIRTTRTHQLHIGRA